MACGRSALRPTVVVNRLPGGRDADAKLASLAIRELALTTAQRLV